MKTRFKEQDGQATVELALLIPFLALFLLLIIQVTMVVREHVLVANASRSAARELSVDKDHARAIAAAKRSVPGADVFISRPATPGQYLTVTVKETVQSNMPLVGIVFPAVTVSSKTTMRVEK